MILFKGPCSFFLRVCVCFFLKIFYILHACMTQIGLPLALGAPGMFFRVIT